MLLAGPQGRIDVSWFGVVGDNSTDNTSGIVKAFAAAAAMTTPGTLSQDIYFPSGIYLTSPITALNFGITIEGAGPTSTLIKSLDGTGNVFDLTPVLETSHAVVLKNFGVDGHGGASNVGD